VRVARFNMVGWNYVEGYVGQETARKLE